MEGDYFPDDRASTPPIDDSIGLRRSLGMVTSPRAPRRSSSTKSNDSSSFMSSRFSESSFGSSSRCSWCSPSSSNTSSLVNPFRDESRVLNDSFKQPLLVDVSRYRQEFIELAVLGSGEYGCVFKCICRINGAVYAVKRTRRPISYTKNELYEIFAHAILQHPNIVCHYSTWFENGFIYMQNEYCNEGSLKEFITSGPLDENTLWKVLEHIALSLKYIHSLNLVHMDVKPENIFLHRGMKIALRASDVKYDSDDQEEVVFKLGDFGHLRKVRENASNIDEGDVRYLANEILQDNHSNLPKADIFSLGLTIYEAAGGGPLPKNGDVWHKIRGGKIKKIINLSPTLNNLILRMIDRDPLRRPSATDVIIQCPN